MIRKSNMIKMALAIGLVVVIGVGTTLAYLTDVTDKVTNTFVMGNGIDIDLLETKYGENKKTVVNKDFTKNIYDGLLPSDHVKKDPTVRVHKNSPDCYVFMKVEGIDALEAVDTNEDGIGDFEVTGYNRIYWEMVRQKGKKDGIYVYVGNPTKSDKVIPKPKKDIDLKELFTTVNYSRKADGIAPENGLPPIEVQACAIQAKGLKSEEALKVICNEVWQEN